MWTKGFLLYYITKKYIINSDEHLSCGEIILIRRKPYLSDISGEIYDS